jgi:hypothetical protein
MKLFPLDVGSDASLAPGVDRKSDLHFRHFIRHNECGFRRGEYLGNRYARPGFKA